MCILHNVMIYIGHMYPYASPLDFKSVFRSLVLDPRRGGPMILTSLASAGILREEKTIWREIEHDGTFPSDVTWT